MKNTYVVKSNGVVRAFSVVALLIMLISISYTVLMIDTNFSRVILILILIFLAIAVFGLFQNLNSFKLHIEKSLKIEAPFYKRNIDYESIDYLTVQSDNGMNAGFINWPVTKIKSPVIGTRINVGGSACLNIFTNDNKFVQIVLSNQSQAQEVKEMIEKSMIIS